MEIISNTIILILSALSLISLIVAIHELGHFLVARYFGVTQHLLNVPTKLISLKHLNKHEW